MCTQCRFAVANGTVGVGKSDGILQQTGLTVRSSNPRADMDNSSLLSDKRDCPGGSEKERGHLRAVNKYAYNREAQTIFVI